MNLPRTIKWLKRPVVLLFLVTLLVRLWVISRLTATPLFDPNGGDMKFYNDWALRILRGEWSDGYAFYGLPGYPFLMAGIYKVFGYNPFFLSFFQAFCEALTASFIYRIGLSAFSSTSHPGLASKIGILASLGYAFYNPAETFSVILMPTSLLVAVFWGVVLWAVSDSAKAIGHRKIAIIGLAVGVIAMVVATIFFIVPLVLTKIWVQTGNRRFRSTLSLSITFAGCIIIGCSPAFLHNLLITQDPVLLSAHGGLNFYVGNNREANGYPKIPAELSSNQAGMLRDSISLAEKALGGNATNPIKRSAVSRYWSAKASTYIRENPWAWTKLVGLKVRNFWSAYQYDDLTLINLFASEGITTPGIRFGIISALGLVGMVFSYSAFPKSRWVSIAILLHMASLLTVFVTERYRLAAAPGLLLLSSFLVFYLYEQLTSASWPRSYGIVGCLTAASFVVTVRPAQWGIDALEAYNSGILNIDFNRLDKAEKQLLFALSQVPDNDEVNFALGRLYLAKKDDQLAKNYFRSTLECNPAHDRALSSLGAIALRQKMPRAAENFLEKSLKIEPASALSHFLLAQALYDQNKLDEAQLEIDVALKAFAQNEKFLYLKKQIEARRVPATLPTP